MAYIIVELLRIQAIKMGDSLVAENANTSEGVQVSLHPLPLLNISEHYTRVRIQSAASSTGSSANEDAGVKGELERLVKFMSC